MKKVFLVVLLSIMMLFSVTQAVTLTIVQPQGTVTMTRPSGSQITLKDLTNQIKWWKVISGGVEVIDGGFTMPNNNVTVEAMYTGNVITVVQSDNGTITPGTVGVELNGSKTFTITPNEGYGISDIRVDGASVLSSSVTNGNSKTYTFTNVTSDHTITAMFEKMVVNYTITASAGTGGTISPSGTTTVTEGSSQTFNIAPNDGYVLSDVIIDGTTSVKDSVTANGDGSVSYTFENVASSHTITASFEKNIIVNEDTSGANAPVLIEGLNPVNWDGEAWATVDNIADWKYNYNSVATSTHSTVEGTGDGAWANAMTEDGSLYVWIPRYTYKITSGAHTSSQKSWNSLDDPGSAKIEVKFSNGIIDDTSNSYKKHSAFTLGTDELTGIWVAKYEASRGDTIESQVMKPTASSNVAKFIPNVTSWGSISVSKMYDYAYNTFRNADSHLMKNTEWGAVAYLTNAVGRIPYINDNSNYITGIAGSSQNDSSTTTSTTNSWNTAAGVKASTTHNVYGIYDMSGGTSEYVAAYYTEGDTSYLLNDSFAGRLYTAANNPSTAKYVDTYSDPYTSYKTGDAVYETSNGSSNSTSDMSYAYTSWDRDYSRTIDFDYPVFRRGGMYNDGSSAGIFTFHYMLGNDGPYFGFRAVLAIPPTAPSTYTITATSNAGGEIWPTEATIGSDEIADFSIYTDRGYKISSILVNGNPVTITNELNMTYTVSNVTSDQTIVVTFESDFIPPNPDTSGANAPVLASDLTPVNWNWQTYSWDPVDDIANWKYNYNSVATSTHSTVAGNGDGAWANAMTADGSLYVWIPRYTYRITTANGYNQSVNSWNSLDNPGTGKVEIKFSNGTTDDTSSSYIKHPAFTFGTTELRGIWVAKYEASRNDATSSSVGTGTIVSSKPGVKSWGDIGVSEAFDYAYSLNRSLDSHMMKNTEWGAVAYLTNAIGRIPYINNYYGAGEMRYVTGYSGSSQDQVISSSNEYVHSWDTARGVKGSTTHNVYGIFDMSGGVWEYVAAYYTAGNEYYFTGEHGDQYAGSLYTAANNSSTSKYVDKYADFYETTENTGSALAETSSGGEWDSEEDSWSYTSWDGDYGEAPYYDNPVLMRGGRISDTYNAGIFSFNRTDGYSENMIGFRVVFAIPFYGLTCTGTGCTSTQHCTEGGACLNCGHYHSGDCVCSDWGRVDCYDADCECGGWHPCDLCDLWTCLQYCSCTGYVDCSHDTTDTHYYCVTHDFLSTTSGQSHCVHGYTSQHNY